MFKNVSFRSWCICFSDFPYDIFPEHKGQRYNTLKLAADIAFAKMAVLGHRMLRWVHCLGMISLYFLFKDFFFFDDRFLPSLTAFFFQVSFLQSELHSRTLETRTTAWYHCLIVRAFNVQYLVTLSLRTLEEGGVKHNDWL